jgi:sulfate/thiosulfate transport system ATP-binding protein
MGIDVRGLSKRFDGVVALDGVDLAVGNGELLALLGPSGSGKTTLLRIIAGLEQPDAGALRIDDRDALGLPPRARHIGFVFQHYALFRHMTVFANVAFGLSVRPRSERPSRAAIAERVNELLSLVQLDGLAARYPAQLSGGQRQRVALARALAVEPRVLLLDEPFGALDAKVRVELRHWLRALHERLALTTLFVTHDQEEALELADRVAILNAGRLEQDAPPRALYDRPATAFVANFLGEVNRLPCTIHGGRACIAGIPEAIAADGVPDGDGVAFVRPHEIELMAAGSGGAGPVVVRSLSVIGPRTRIYLDHQGRLIEVDADRRIVDELSLGLGAAVNFRLQVARVFPAPV